MFSGGLDSLAGAVETARAGKSLVLVSHRPVAMLDSRQRQLFSALNKEFPNQLIHTPAMRSSYRDGQNQNWRLFLVLTSAVQFATNRSGAKPPKESFPCINGTGRS